MLAATALLALCVPARAAENGAEAQHPNVIIIITDDQGTVDVNSYGAEELITPGIDTLAARGVKFTQFYAAAPVCSPSRAGLLTGKFPLHAGLPTNAGGAPSAKPRDHRHGGGLPTEQVTIAEMLKKAGYATAMIGKWHLGVQPKKLPSAQGFDYWFGFLGGCIDSYSHYSYWGGTHRHDLWENGEPVHYNGQFFADLMVRKATKFMKKHREEPFFIYFALNIPHYPLQPSRKWLERYEDLPYPRNIYAAWLSMGDQRIAELIENVDELGLTKQTIIIFQSDHGHSTEKRAHGGGGSNGPFRGAKFSLFEGGIRVPAIISWPGHLPQGVARRQLAHSCDWMPTIAELCNVEPPENIDGESLVEVIRSPDAPSPHGVLHWYVGSGKNAQWAVRKGPWKLIHNVRSSDPTAPPLSKEDKQWFLSNLEKNPGETINFADEYPKVVKQLRELHRQWMAKVKGEK